MPNVELIDGESGRVLFRGVPLDAIEDMTRPGRVDEAVAYWLPKVQRVALDKDLERYVRASGADASESVEDTRLRALWIAAGSYKDMNVEDERTSPNARDRVKVITGEKIKTFGGWYRHDRVMLDGREIGRIQTRRRNKRTETITLGPDPSGSPNGGAVLGSDIGWLLRIAGEKA